MIPYGQKQEVLMNLFGLTSDKFQFIEQIRKIIINPTVVTTPNSYYVFTTTHGINLPYFAPFRILVTESGAKHPL